MTDFNYTWRRSGATPAVITGNQVARRHLTKCERARLAGAIMDGTTRVEKLNQRQAATLCGISIAYARRMRRPQSDVPQLQAAE
jgi:hypothetical protein